MYPTIGQRVRITTLEDDLRGLMVVAKHLTVRQEGMTGIVTGPVPGHGGDVWWVRHESVPIGDVGAYIYTEIETIEPEVQRRQR